MTFLRRLVGLVSSSMVATAAAALPVAPALADQHVPPLDLQFAFDSDMPQEARDAMLAVEDILDDHLASTVPVRVRIAWDLGGDPNTLASAGAVNNIVNFPGTPRPDVEYPIALANAIAEQDFTPGEFHVDSAVNGDIDWDYSVGSTAPEKLDFIGTMMHEVLHGLGFFGNAGCNEGTCFSSGPTGFPGVFDTFVATGGGTPITSFPEGSAELEAAITSDDIYWVGPMGVAAARSAESGTDNCGPSDDLACPDRPKIHAPTTYEPGSSMSHWDEFTYSALNPNAMMTASGSNGELAQTYGPMTRAVMWEIGWPAPATTEPEPEPEPTPTEQPTPPGRAFDGNPATTERAAQPTPTAAAIAMSQASFADDGAQVATISRDDKFADALAASALGAYGPLLFTDKDALEAAVRAEVDRVLAPGATVYIVGGTGAVSQAVEDELVGAGYAVTRLRGADRFETAVRITEEVVRLNPDADSLLFARGFGPAADPNGSAAWADSISAAAYAAASRNPLLLVQTGAVPQAVEDYLLGDGAGLSNLRWVVLGGTAAVSQDVFDRLGADIRVRGSGREATSIAIARELFGVAPVGARSYAIVHGRDQLGWGWGLAVSGVAGRAGAPILLVTDQVTPEVRAEVTACGSHQVDLLVSGPTAVVSSSVQSQLDAVDNSAC